MSPAHRPPWSHFLLAGFLIAIFLLQSISASLQKSPVTDEPAHLASGLSYLDTHVFHANLQHPPLLKEMSALSLWMAGIHWPKNELADSLIRGGPESKDLEWPVGHNIIHENGADRVLFWARLPLALLGGFLGFLIWWWGRELVGPGAALGALFLYALDPTFVAHAALVTTDVGLAAFGTLFLFALWRYIQRPGWQRMALAGVALGAALGAKFSAVFLLPIAAVLLAVALIPVKEPEEPRARRRKPTPEDDAARALRRKQRADFALAFLGMCLIAAVVVEALYFFPSDPFLYLTGMRRVNADHDPTYAAYLHGDLQKHFNFYFVATYLLKEPLASILLACAGLLLLLRNRSIPALTKWFLLLTPLVFFVAISLLADDLGIRYIIPTLPFAYLLGGLALAALFRHPGWGRYAAGALCVWMAVEAVGIYPDHLSYFNEAACLLESPGKVGLDGGSRCGVYWLDDSNVDWGQGLKQLRAWMDAHPRAQTAGLTYFGTYPPEGYNLRNRKVEPSALFADPAPGLYAVSSYYVARIPALGATMVPVGGAWLRSLQPVAIVGHAFYIYDVH